ITEAYDLVHDPRAWEPRLAKLETDHPETAAAVDEIRALGQLRPQEHANRIATFKSKLSPFRFASNFRATFGATTPAINWDKVVNDGQALLLDFRDVESPAMKKFCLLWV